MNTPIRSIAVIGATGMLGAPVTKVLKAEKLLCHCSCQGYAKSAA